MLFSQKEKRERRSYSRRTRTCDIWAIQVVDAQLFSSQYIARVNININFTRLIFLSSTVNSVEMFTSRRVKRVELIISVCFQTTVGVSAICQLYKPYRDETIEGFKNSWVRLNQRLPSWPIKTTENRQYRSTERQSLIKSSVPRKCRSHWTFRENEIMRDALSERFTIVQTHN